MNAADGFEAFKGRVRGGVEELLGRAFAARPETVVRQASMYASLDGGHRWRAMATLAAGAIFDPGAFDVCLPTACGVELAHAASLILDDLPSMDNAAVRRGRPCVHLAFPDWAVDMAPVFLVMMAYELSLNNGLASHERRVAATVALSRAGVRMIGGQESDVTQAAGGDVRQALLDRYRLKTGEGFAVAAKAGAILCGASPRDTQALYECGMALGLAYQIADDVADCLAPTHQTGKSANRDGAKLTSVDVFGLGGARAQAERYRQESVAVLGGFGREAGLLRCLVAEACCLAR
jgi:geranylgeranyl pyrophosphate synthase